MRAAVGHTRLRVYTAEPTRAFVADLTTEGSTPATLMPNRGLVHYLASLHEAIAKSDAGKYDEALAILDRLLPIIRDPAIEEQTARSGSRWRGEAKKK